MTREATEATQRRSNQVGRKAARSGCVLNLLKEECGVWMGCGDTVLVPASVSQPFGSWLAVQPTGMVCTTQEAQEAVLSRPS